MNVTNEIVTVLQQAIENAYAPYSRHPVAAVAVSEDSQHFVGVNVECAHYKGVCAEASALAAMVAAGQRRLAAIYIMGPGASPCAPCGDCRQRINEFADADTPVYLLTRRGDSGEPMTIDSLLPHAFSKAGLDHTD